MQLIENKYETALLMKLPPNARDIAEHLLTVKPLDVLLTMWLQNEPDLNLLSQHHVTSLLWEDILKATILAKITYFFENPNFSEEEILYLLKAACASAGYPLKAYSLAEVIEMSENEMPIFHQWLLQFSHLLKQVHQQRGS
jgi:hypothetical protein